MTELPAWLRGMARVLFRESQRGELEPEVAAGLRSLAFDCQANALLVELADDFLAEAPTVPGRNATRVGVAPQPGEET